ALFVDHQVVGHHIGQVGDTARAVIAVIVAVDGNVGAVGQDEIVVIKEELEASIGKQVFTPNFESEYLRFEKVLSK
ncbi:MAG: hypothetical protein IJB28_00505, partial [Bacteroidaceae bacterium]|nr:hypothetical protein [Bacteroidaceae bacterium]